MKFYSRFRKWVNCCVLSLSSCFVVISSCISPCYAFSSGGLFESTAEALAWLIALTCGAVMSGASVVKYGSGSVNKAVASYFGDVEAKFLAFCIENGKTVEDFNSWFDSIMSGILDTGSDFYKLLLTFENSDVLPATKGGPIYVPLTVGDDLAENLTGASVIIDGRPTMGSGVPKYINITKISNSKNIYPFMIKSKDLDGNIHYNLMFIGDRVDSSNSATFDFTADYEGYWAFSKTIILSNKTYEGVINNEGVWDQSKVENKTYFFDLGASSGNSFAITDEANFSPGNFIYLDISENVIFPYVSPFSAYSGYVASYVADKMIDSGALKDAELEALREDTTEEDVKNVGVASTKTGALTGQIALSNDSAVSFDSIYSGVIDGTYSLDDIETWSGARAYDTATGTVVGSTSWASTIPIADVLANTEKNETAQKLKNPSLSTIFPFCIPFDVYAIFKIMDSPAVAPSFSFSIPYDFDGHTYEVTIDLSVFEPVAVVFRAMLLILFVIGLAMVTRNLIRG